MTFNEFFDIYATVSDDVRIEIVRILDNFQVDHAFQGTTSGSSYKHQLPLQQIPLDNPRFGYDNQHEVAG